MHHVVIVHKKGNLTSLIEDLFGLSKDQDQGLSKDQGTYQSILLNSQNFERIYHRLNYRH